MQSFEPDRIIEDATVRMWDLAVTPKTDADFTVGGKITLASVRFGEKTIGGYLFVRDIVRLRASFPTVRETIYETALTDGVDVSILIPVAGTQKGFYQDFKNDIRFSDYHIVPIPETTAKLARALRWIGRLHMGKVILLDAPWNADFLLECERFTGHEDKHDDQIDVLSGAYHYLANMIYDDEQEKKVDKQTDDNDAESRIERDGPPQRPSRRSWRRGRTTFL